MNRRRQACSNQAGLLKNSNKPYFPIPAKANTKWVLGKLKKKLHDDVHMTKQQYQAKTPAQSKQALLSARNKIVQTCGQLTQKIPQRLLEASFKQYRKIKRRYPKSKWRQRSSFRRWVRYQKRRGSMKFISTDEVRENISKCKKVILQQTRSLCCELRKLLHEFRKDHQKTLRMLEKGGVFFEFGKMHLSPAGYRYVKAVKRVLTYRSRLFIIRGLKVKITGHADRQAKNEKANYTVSRIRARRVASALGHRWVHGKPEGRGSSHPFRKGLNGLVEPLNRRVQFEFVGKGKIKLRRRYRVCRRVSLSACPYSATGESL